MVQQSSLHLLMHLDGYVMLLGTERGPTYMNSFNEEQFNLGGGFSYIKSSIDNEIYCTAYRYAPKESLGR